MANEPTGPNFQLNGAQMFALAFIEFQQNQLVAAANAIVARTPSEHDAARLLSEAARIMESAKLEWLHGTQRAIRVVAAIPSKVNGALVHG